MLILYVLYVHQALTESATLTFFKGVLLSGGTPCMIWRCLWVCPVSGPGDIWAGGRRWTPRGPGRPPWGGGRPSAPPLRRPPWRAPPWRPLPPRPWRVAAAPALARPRAVHVSINEGIITTKNWYVILTRDGWFMVFFHLQSYRPVGKVGHHHYTAPIGEPN